MRFISSVIIKDFVGIFRDVLVLNFVSDLGSCLDMANIFLMEMIIIGVIYECGSVFLIVKVSSLGLELRIGVIVGQRRSDRRVHRRGISKRINMNNYEINSLMMSLSNN
jgi:hypothetical protein